MHCEFENSGHLDPRKSGTIPATCPHRLRVKVTTSRSGALSAFLDPASRRNCFDRFRGIQPITWLLILLAWLAPIACGQEKQETTSRLEGVVFIGESGDPSYVPGAKVLVSGPIMAETETNDEGKYAFNGIPPGTYEVEASFSQLTASHSVTVQANQVATASLQLKPLEVKTSIQNVTAKDEREKSAEPGGTINEKIVRDAPNVDEQFQSLLPLVPGVVRGPDGHINMKGARNTQSGALLNSANVTDPATGSPAISLPIDVVSSVQVISNPYDPQYGKLTGAVSSTDTKTGDYEGYHFSIQNIVPRMRDRDGSIVGIGAATRPG